MDFATPLAIAGKAIEAIKQLREAEKALDQATLKASLADVLSQLADVRLALVDAKEEGFAKEKEIVRLKKDFDVRVNLVESRGFKYFPSRSDSTKPVGLPICPRCETVDGRLILTVASERGMGAKCPQCKMDYHHVEQWREPI